MNHVTLADVMNRDFVGVSESDDIAAAARTMRDAGENTAVVLRGSDPVGVVTAGDVLDVFVGQRDPDTVAEVMSAIPPTLRPEADLEDALAAFSGTEFDALLVANGDGVMGLVTARDIATVPREPATIEETVVVQPSGSTGATAEPDSYSSQSICEACGSLASTLRNVNGQLLCPECRQV